MILRTEHVRQRINGSRQDDFVKDVLMTQTDEPLGMVRKRSEYWVKQGTRGTVLLIHGFGQNRYTWHISQRSFANYLAALGWDVFNVDLRGHGRSRHFGSSRPRQLDDYIRDDVPACVEEAIGLSGHKQVFLIGHSMGGLISYSVAGTHRELVRGVVSVGSPYRFGLGSRTLLALSALASTATFTGIFDGNPPVPLRLFGKHFRAARGLWDSQYFPFPVRAWFPGSVEDDVLDEYLERAFDRTSFSVALGIVRAGQEAALKSHDGLVDYGAAFRCSGVPVLVIAGSEDTLAPPESVRPAFDEAQTEDKTYRLFPLGHIDLVVGREAPATVWPAIAEWLEAR